MRSAPTGSVVAIHVAIYKLASIALPLAMLFGVEAISYRLQNSGAKADPPTLACTGIIPSAARAGLRGKAVA